MKIWALLFFVFGLGGCDGFWRQRAGCEQAVLAFCDLQEHCGGPGAAQCQSERSSLVSQCSFSVAAASACVEAVNTGLDAACTALPTDLPCPPEVITPPVDGAGPTGERDTSYVSCTPDASCFLGACVKPDNRDTGICSFECSDADECLAPTNGLSAVCVPLTGVGSVCTAGCETDDDCGDGLTCADGTSCVPAQ